MNGSRVRAIILRQWYLFPQSIDRITDAFFWPFLDIVLWGLAGEWLVGQEGRQVNFLLALLTGLTFWRVVWQSNYEMSVNLLEECWNRNLTNTLSSPLTKGEWILANLAIAVVKLFVIIGCMCLGVWLMYQLNLFRLGWMWIPFFVSLLLSGLAIGFFASALILHWGIRAQAIGWTFAFLLAPLSAVYYPLSFLPAWAQTIAMVLPTTYIFEGMRALVLEQGEPWRLLLTSLGLNVVYLCATLWFFNHMFERTRAKGFDHLE